MTETINKITFEFGGREMELTGGGSGNVTPGVPIPEDTVDSKSIKNDSVDMQDLTPEVRQKLEALDEENGVTEDELEDSWEEALRQAMGDNA